MSNEKSIGLLMAHLGREFSIECLLSLIEFIQFQNYVYQHLMINTRNNKNIEIEKQLICKEYKIDLPNSIPMSSIVNLKLKFETIDNNNVIDDNDNNNNNNKNISIRSINITDLNDKNMSDNWLINAKIKCYLLYCKYVALGSHYEINVSYRTRDKLINKMNNYNQWLNDNCNSSHEDDDIDDDTHKI